MKDSSPDKLTFWQTFSSVFWAAFGVQKRKTWQRDMSHGSIPAFIAAIVVFIALFIGVIYLIVTLAIGYAT